MAAAGAAVWLEEAWRLTFRWVALAWGVYMSAALLGGVALLPGGVRVLLLASLAVGTIAAVVAAILRTPVSSRATLVGRLERASALKRGTLDLLDGGALVAVADGLSLRLWERAREQARRSRLRRVWPRLVLSSRRETMVALALACAAVVGGVTSNGRWGQRLASAFSPYPTDLSRVTMTVTAEAPAYADRRARLLSLRHGDRVGLSALAGSRLVVQVNGPPGAWTLQLGDGPKRAVGSDLRASAVARAPGRLEIRYGSRRAATLDITMARDTDPSIELAADPAVAATGALRIAYRLRDDLGASRVALIVAGHGRSRVVPLERAVPPGEHASFVDLTADPLAGRLATLRLEARDGARNVGRSQPFRMRLPERSFTGDLARRVVAERRQLLDRPSMRLRIAGNLAALADDPSTYGEGLAVYSGLKAASYRLRYDREPEWLASTAGLLWEIALALDDHGATAALDDLRATMDRLSQAAGSGDEDLIRALSQKLGGQLAEYLQRQVAKLLMESPEDVSQLAASMPALDVSALDRLLQQLRERLAAGDAESAQAMLRDLRFMMESLSFGGPSGRERERAAAAARQAAKEAGELGTEQRGLQARTVEEGIRRIISGDAGGLRAQAGEQQALTEKAARLLRKAQSGSMSQQAAAALERAAAAMQGAADGLRAGDQQQALEQQASAIAELGTAAAALDRAAQAGGSGGPGGMVAGRIGSGLDPIGRPASGFGQGNLRLPDEEQVRRVEAIRALLEARAADPLRSDKERAYYLRLLKRF